MDLSVFNVYKCVPWALGLKSWNSCLTHSLSWTQPRVNYPTRSSSPGRRTPGWETLLPSLYCDGRIARIVWRMYSDLLWHANHGPKQPNDFLREKIMIPKNRGKKLCTCTIQRFSSFFPHLCFCLKPTHHPFFACTFEVVSMMFNCVALNQRFSTSF